MLTCFPAFRILPTPRRRAANLLVRFLLIALVGVLPAAAARATVIQQIVVEHTTLDGTVTSDGDRIEVPTSADVNRAVFASIADPGERFSALGSVGEFGNLGVQADTFSSGELFTQVFISSDEFVNFAGGPRQIDANFIVDGGLLRMDFAPGAALEFQLAVVRQGFGNFSNRFVASIHLEGDPVTGATTFSESGDSLGAVFDGRSIVEIPFSFQSVDLGILQPGEQLELEYLLTIRATIPQFAEILNWQFSDPLSVDGPGEFPLQMDFVSTPVVPEPSTALLIALGLVGLARRSHSVPEAARASLRSEVESS